MNAYEILGLETNASLRDIRTAYRKLALKLHPDKAKLQKNRRKSTDELTEDFNKLQKAYETLLDDDQKKILDDQILNQQKLKIKSRQSQLNVAKFREELKSKEFNQYKNSSSNKRQKADLLSYRPIVKTSNNTSRSKESIFTNKVNLQLDYPNINDRYTDDLTLDILSEKYLYVFNQMAKVVGADSFNDISIRDQLPSILHRNYEVNIPPDFEEEFLLNLYQEEKNDYSDKVEECIELNDEDEDDGFNIVDLSY